MLLKDYSLLPCNSLASLPSPTMNVLEVWCIEFSHVQAACTPSVGIASFLLIVLLRAAKAGLLCFCGCFISPLFNPAFKGADWSWSNFLYLLNNLNETTLLYVVFVPTSNVQLDFSQVDYVEIMIIHPYFGSQLQNNHPTHKGNYPVARYKND